ncbi:MAG: hypothetical protein E7352_00305 [Clostridiales bacterium]|nr:hypothetical protein [Clostridiales bacterium]
MALFRVKCSSCGHVGDISSDCECPKCKNALSVTHEGGVQIYRMGSPVGVAVGYGIYINGQPYGHLANKESVKIPLPYGTYTFHFTCGMTRKCQDVTVEITPEKRIAYIKARIKMGFWSNKIFAELVNAEDMPPMQ